MNINYMEMYEDLKRNKDSIANIDKNFFFDFVENLINRNKELEEENGLLKRANNIAKDVKLEDITQAMNKAYKDFMNEFIPKSKIREKIEELDNQEKEELKGMKGQDRYFVKQMYQTKKSVLQDLLEKE